MMYSLLTTDSGILLDKEYIDAWFTSFCAAAVCVSIPIATLFIIVHRFYVEGMSSGAVKG